jgi:DNA polymerase-1
MNQREFVRVSETGEIDTAPLPYVHDGFMSLDFEATGTLVYAKDFQPRLCQVSFDGRYAFIFNAQVHDEFITNLVDTAKQIIVHGASYDLAVLDHCFGVPLEMTWPKTVCTQEMARLLYPTESAKLKDLARKELDVEVDHDKELRAEFARLKLRPIARGYELIPLDNEVYIKYAGLDAIDTFKLWMLWKDRFDES